MHSLTSQDSSSIESWIYDDFDCQFAICEKCFWSATLFKSTVRQNKKNNARHNDIIHICPMCSNSDISLISIANDIYRK
jgi:hypothetical protein